MGNSGRKLSLTGAAAGGEIVQPGRPKVKLGSRGPATQTEVSDEVVLTWKPCSRRDKGYDIEMWDLGLQEWVHVTTSEKSECTLSNILSGILYRFRVTALTPEGLPASFPSDPSEPFVLNIPGVQIAPYWIQTPPTIVSLTVNQTLTLSASALGTPAANFHWYKDGEELFLRHNLEIETSRESSTLILSHVESTDGGMYTVTAVNVVGKCSWECSVDLKAKPAFTLPPNLKRQIAFQEDELMSLKVPLIAVPPPLLKLEKLDEKGEVERSFEHQSTAGGGGSGDESREVKLKYKDNLACIKIEAVKKWHTGDWRLTATNPIGTADVALHFRVRSEPAAPTVPEVTEATPEGVVYLRWEKNLEDEELYESIQYQVEYNRETWDIWLKGCITSETTCKLTDLFPGSYYGFRVRTLTKCGRISEPSPSSERVFIGMPLEDELFGLPGGNYPKERPSGKPGKLFQYGTGIRNSKRYSSLSQDLSAASPHAGSAEAAEGLDEVGGFPAKIRHHQQRSSRGGGRQYSLERDVYYFEDKRTEVVNYEANIGKKIGSTVSNKFGLSDDEVQIYKRSLGELCSQMMRASRQGIAPAVTSAEAREQQKQKQRMGSAVSLEKVFQRMDSTKSNSSLAAATSEAMSVDEKARLESSLSQLCMRLKSMSREEMARKPRPEVRSPNNPSRGRGRGGRGAVSNSSLTLMNRKYESYPPMKRAMSCEDARQALTASCERIAGYQDLVRKSSPQRIDALEMFNKTRDDSAIEKSPKKQRFQRPQSQPPEGTTLRFTPTLEPLPQNRRMRQMTPKVSESIEKLQAPPENEFRTNLRPRVNFSGSEEVLGKLSASLGQIHVPYRPTATALALIGSSPPERRKRPPPPPGKKLPPKKKSSGSGTGGANMAGYRSNLLSEKLPPENAGFLPTGNEPFKQATLDALRERSPKPPIQQQQQPEVKPVPRKMTMVPPTNPPSVASPPPPKPIEIYTPATKTPRRERPHSLTSIPQEFLSTAPGTARPQGPVAAPPNVPLTSPPPRAARPQFNSAPAPVAAPRRITTTGSTTKPTPLPTVAHAPSAIKSPNDDFPFPPPDDTPPLATSAPKGGGGALRKTPSEESKSSPRGLAKGVGMMKKTPSEESPRSGRGMQRSSASQDSQATPRNTPVTSTPPPTTSKKAFKHSFDASPKWYRTSLDDEEKGGGFQPTLTPILSSRSGNTKDNGSAIPPGATQPPQPGGGLKIPHPPMSPDLSTTSKVSVISDATLQGQPSLETDPESSATIIAHNDTFDYETDIEHCLSESISVEMPS